MEATSKRLFENDRRMELKMRIAATKMGATTKQIPPVIKMGDLKPDIIGRLIKRVREL
jgi:hypothetical protein